MDGRDIGRNAGHLRAAPDIRDRLFQHVAESQESTEDARPHIAGRTDGAFLVGAMALYLSWLAVAYADANEPEEAAAAAERVLSLSADVASERTAERVCVVLARLAEYADVPEVRAVLDSAA
ncbi:hypothetical protein AB0903_22870 [Streptomyces sp. NPDC048389]|uniref:hypothetical protein n=1 Tax=Streptomyces sp. NPDC048389 TaxID=3154622 RepID=UPI003454308D